MILVLSNQAVPAQRDIRSLLKLYLSSVRLDRGSEGAEWRGLHSLRSIDPNGLGKKSIVSSIQTSIYEQVLKLFLIKPKDIAKECLKFASPWTIDGNNWLKNPYCIDYGFEAAWSGYHDGIDAIPGALIKYACTDFCYQQLCKGGQIYGLDYPEKIKQHALLYSIARVFTPLFIKHWISHIIDTILNQLYDSEQDNDQMLETYNFTDIS